MQSGFNLEDFEKIVILNFLICKTSHYGATFTTIYLQNFF